MIKTSTEFEDLNRSASSRLSSSSSDSLSLTPESMSKAIELVSAAARCIVDFDFSQRGEATSGRSCEVVRFRLPTIIGVGERFGPWRAAGREWTGGDRRGDRGRDAARVA